MPQRQAADSDSRLQPRDPRVYVGKNEPEWLKRAGQRLRSDRGDDKTGLICIVTGAVLTCRPDSDGQLLEPVISQHE